VPARRDPVAFGRRTGEASSLAAGSASWLRDALAVTGKNHSDASYVAFDLE
jgi:hypothetical protein